MSRSNNSDEKAQARKDVLRAKTQARNAKQRAADYKRKLKLLEKAGIYNPLSETELTAYRKRRINSAYQEYRDYIDNPRNPFFFVSAEKLNSRDKKRFLSDAKSLSMRTTKKGLFIQKEGQRRARIVKDKKRDEFDIVLTGKVKWGENKGKKISQRIPIAPEGKLEDERQRLENMAQSFGTLGRDDVLSFVLYENNVEIGAHRSTYDSVNGVMTALNAYHKDNKAAKLAFFRLVTVQKSSRVAWRRDHPLPDKRMARRGRIYWEVVRNSDQAILYVRESRAKAQNDVERLMKRHPGTEYTIRRRTERVE